jgi:hypothetical protein
VGSRRFIQGITGLIIINTIIMAMEYESMPNEYGDVLEYLNFGAR